METLQFITNINCGGCVSRVTPFLDAVTGIANWKVDTSVSTKLLTVNSAVPFPAGKVIAVLKEAGFTGTQI
jgi:copper chaperone